MKKKALRTILAMSLCIVMLFSNMLPAFATLAEEGVEDVMVSAAEEIVVSSDADTADVSVKEVLPEEDVASDVDAADDSEEALPEEDVAFDADAADEFEEALPEEEEEEDVASDADAVNIDLQDEGKIIVPYAGTTSVSVNIVWDDGDDADGLRPGSVGVELEANVPDFGGWTGYDSATLNEGNGWKKTWEGLDPIDSFITGYRVKVTRYYENIDGYGSPVISNNGNNWTIKYTHTPTTQPEPEEPETTDVTAKIVWNDGNDADGLRPNEMRVALIQHYVNSSSIIPDQEIKYQVLNAANNWTYTWEDLSLVEGVEPYIEEISYYVIVTTATPNGYNSSESSEDGTWMFKYTHTPTPKPEELTQLTVNIVWEDQDNMNGFRPTSVPVKLWVNHALIGTYDYGADATLSEENGWTYTWSELPIADEMFGEKIKLAYYPYSGIADSDRNLDVVGYQRVITGGGTAWTITYTLLPDYAPRRTDVNVSIVWKDDDEKSRPEEVEVTLYADLKEAEKVTLTAPEWAYTWENLLEKNGSDTIIYTVNQPKVSGYSSTSSFNRVYSTETENGKVDIVFTNTKIEEVSVSVKVEWKDNNNRSGNRPDELSVQLYRGTAPIDPETGRPSNMVLVPNSGAILRSSDGWAYTWNELPKYAPNGEEYIYIVVGNFAQMSGYSSDLIDDGNGNYTLVNKSCHDTYVTIAKTWDDADNQDGKRPDSITVDLYSRDDTNPDWTHYGTYVITEEDGWELVVEELPYTPDVEYKLEERSVQWYTLEGIDTSGELPEGTYRFDITNKYVPETTEIRIEKVWEDEDDNDGKRPEEIEVTLSGVIVNADGGEKVVVSETVKVRYDKANDSWGYTWDELPVYAEGKKIVYTVTENPVDGYDSDVEDNGDGSFTITNTHTPETTEICVEKVWNDGDDRDGKRPEEIEVTLSGVITKADGNVEEVVSETVKVRYDKANDSWGYTWDELPVYAEGKKIVYTVTESPVDGYGSDVEDNGDGSFTITNTYVPETTEIRVEKVWDDADDNDGKRPEEIEVTLSGVIVNADGEEEEIVSETVKVRYDKASDSWGYSWDELPVYAGGIEIVYTVTESPVDGYDSDVEDNGDGSFTITNTHVPETIEIKLEKIWDDEDDVDGKRPEEVEVTLVGTITKDDGTVEEVVRETVKVYYDEETNSWTHTWDELPKYVDGVEVVYSLEMDSIDDYDTVVEDNGDGTFTITSVYRPKSEPTSEPTEEPTSEPTEEPTSEPTEEPTSEPTEKPTSQPTEKPTSQPTEEPTSEPTEKPTSQPTEKPTPKPTEAPTSKPTAAPGTTPQTGDGSRMILWIMLLIVSFAGIVVTAHYCRKR